MKIILEPIRTIQVESFSSEKFQCILSFAQRKRSIVCFIVNEGFCFNFSLLISLQDSRTRWPLETLALTLDFSTICFVAYCELEATRKIARLSRSDKDESRPVLFFCHNLQHFLRNCVLLYDFFLLLSIFLLLITVAVLVQEFAFPQTRLILFRVPHTYKFIFIMLYCNIYSFIDHEQLSNF